MGRILLRKSLNLMKNHKIINKDIKGVKSEKSALEKFMLSPKYTWAPTDDAVLYCTWCTWTAAVAVAVAAA